MHQPKTLIFFLGGYDLAMLTIRLDHLASTLALSTSALDPNRVDGV